MNKEAKRERNKDIVQLKKLGLRIRYLCIIFKMKKENLISIIDTNWHLHAYPNQEEILGIEKRREIKLERIISINDNGKLIEVGLS